MVERISALEYILNIAMFVTLLCT